MKKYNVSDEYKIAATEVLSILEYLPKTEVDKIPNKFKEFLKETSIFDYNPNFDYSLGLDKIELNHKTKLLLAMIYKNYICSEKERIEYNSILYKNEERYQNELREKYNPYDIFKKENKQEEKNIQTSNNALIEYKETFFNKFKKIILKIFK